MNTTEIYQTIALIVFILISVAFIKPPQGLIRVLKSWLRALDRWL
jgi:hypothetical protein